MTLHRRIPAHSHKFARAPAGAQGLYPRFTPTAIWDDIGGDSPSPTPDRPTTSATPATQPSNTPVASSPPPANPNPNPVTRVLPTTTSTVIPVTSTTPPSVPTARTTQVTNVAPLPVQPTASVVTSPNLVLTTATSTSLNLQPLPTTTLNGQASLTPLPSFATRSLASAVGSGTTSSESATSTSSPSGTSTGAVVGGIAAGLAGVAVIVLGVFFLVRRWRKRTEDNTFSADHFRRSAVLLDDPPTHEDTINRGYNPRPPSMIERKIASSTPSPYAAYANQPTGPTGYNSYGSFGPGEVVFSPPPSASLPDSAYSYGNAPGQYNSISPYAQSPYSPASPMSSQVTPYDAPHAYAAPAVVPPPRHPGTQVERQATLPTPAALHPGHTSVATVGSIPTGDYVDLTRSSVSPYQAAQYVEISKQLNTEVPVGLTTPEMAQHQPDGQDASPFSDPQRYSTQLPSPYDHTPAEADPTAPVVPVASAMHARVDSQPPSLPEIHVPSRVSGIDEFPAQKFPATPSPLASSFAVSTPPGSKTEFATLQNVEVATPANANASAPVVPRIQNTTDASKRPPTVYDEGDAYGGF